VARTHRWADVDNNLLAQAGAYRGPKGPAETSGYKGARGNGEAGAYRGSRENGDSREYEGLRGFGAQAGPRDRRGLAGSLAYVLQRWSDQWFAVTDTEAYWWGWQINKALGGLGRRYRDIRFDTLAACGGCAGAGAWADAPCGPCQGTGRISPGR
jgi:hypothetical protein